MTRNPMKDEEYEGRDDASGDQIEDLKNLVRKYQAIHELISDVIEEGEGLQDRMTPENYTALVDTLAELAGLSPAGV